MNLSRFVLGLTLLALALLVSKFITDPLAGSNIAYTLGEATGGVLGGLVLGLFIWAPIRLIRGADKAPDARRYALYTAGITVTFLIVSQFLIETPLSKSERLEFLSGFESTCFASQRELDEYASLTDPQLRKYCSCISSSLSTDVTEGEIKYVIVNEVLPASLQKKTQGIAARCSRQLLQKWQEGNK